MEATIGARLFRVRIHGRRGLPVVIGGRKAMAKRRPKTTKPRVGWIGVGKMGGPLVRTLLRAGYSAILNEPLPENRASAVAAGARVAVSIEELVAECDVVVSTLKDDRVLQEVIFAPGGLAHCLRPDQIFIEMSTVSPRASADIAEVLAARGVAYLRAPMSGSTATAGAGALTIIASGPRAAWDRVEPMLSVLAAKRFWVGEKEEARYAKLAVNVLVGSTSALLAEALAVGRCGALSAETLLAIICDSAAGSPLLRYKRDAIVNGDFDAAFSVAQMIKDFELIGEVADAAGLPLEFVEQVRRRYERARREGLSEQDYFVLVRDQVGDSQTSNPSERSKIASTSS
jgi:3-hydroxyisobutyrate dehydrogenase-like beta-hydroxyacid dehydrogenase